MIRTLRLTTGTVKPKGFKRINKSKNRFIIQCAAFKCKVCGETDEWQSGSNCGNDTCPYK